MARNVVGTRHGFKHSPQDPRKAMARRALAVRGNIRGGTTTKNPGGAAPTTKGGRTPSRRELALAHRISSRPAGTFAKVAAMKKRVK